MDIRAEKLAKARKKLRDHQEKKVVSSQKEEPLNDQKSKEILNDNLNPHIDNRMDQDQNHVVNKNEADSFNNHHIDTNFTEIKPDVVTEMLISNKTNLEFQINEMSAKLAHLESLYAQEKSNHNNCKQKNIELQYEINNITTRYSSVAQDALDKDEKMENLMLANQHLHDERNNLYEQVELTKSILTSKERENIQLHNQVSSYQSQIDLLQLQLRQLTTDSAIKFEQSNKLPDETENLLDKIFSLEQKIEILKKDKEEINSHYEHYVQDLNKRLTAEVTKNEGLSKDLQDLYNREHSLVEQISEMEIRMQNYTIKSNDFNEQEKADEDLQNQCLTIQNELDEVRTRYEELQKQHQNCLEKIKELTQARENENHDNVYRHENVDMSKLNADIASDKLAAQRATEQNEKLKSDIEGLQQIIVKMGKDKLELTEKWTHEKQLNKGLALKLAEVEEFSKNFQIQLKAKDDEMIRLVNEYREMETKHDKILKDVNEMKQNTEEHKTQNSENQDAIVEENHNNLDHNMEQEQPLLLPETPHVDKKVKLEGICIQKEDAMIKLQERFLNIMDEVANLSDEKHRLEHIILQLQNETDTICEYVALYQQQRSLLQKREAERSNQLKIYQAECDKLKRHLEELRDLLLRFAADEELASFLKDETRLNDLARVKELLEKLQNCSLINPKFKNLDLNIFYPCNCCSGQLIDI